MGEADLCLIQSRVPAAVRDKLAERARHNCRSLSGEVAFIVQANLTEPEAQQSSEGQFR